MLLRVSTGPGRFAMAYTETAAVRPPLSPYRWSMAKYITESGKKVVTLIPGDGIGAEVTSAAQRLIAAAGVGIQWDHQVAGAEAFRAGVHTGVPAATLDSIRRSRVVLKGPLETPVGFGDKSANVTLRKLFEMYANIRPVRELPGVHTPFSGRGIDMIVVRENIEDLYGGIEHMQTPGVSQTLKLVSRKGSEKIIRAAFALAQSEQRTKVTCVTKANIMKLSDGLFKKTFEDVARDYPDITAEHMIVDNCAQQLVIAPEQFDVLVTLNLYGDILSDLAAGLVGGLGFAPSANLADSAAMFEAVHGSAPTIAGKDIANPTALMLTAVQLLRYLDEADAASRVENAVLVTLEDGTARTADIARGGSSVGTVAFTDAVIGNLGRRPVTVSARTYGELKLPQLPQAPDFVAVQRRRSVGADVFVEWAGAADTLGQALELATAATTYRLRLISNRGTQVYPVLLAEPDLVDVWRCRFLVQDAQADAVPDDLLELLRQVGTVAPWMHVEKLQEFDGEDGFSKAQGEE